LDRLLATVRLRHGANADEIVGLNVSDSCRLHPEHFGIVQQLHIHVRPVGLLDRDNTAVDLVDRATDGLRLLRIILAFRSATWRSLEPFFLAFLLTQIAFPTLAVTKHHHRVTHAHSAIYNMVPDTGCPANGGPSCSNAGHQR
jgi:hypothetical protein